MPLLCLVGSSSAMPTTNCHKCKKMAPKHLPWKARSSRELRRLQAERMDDLQAVLRYNVALQARTPSSCGPTWRLSTAADAHVFVLCVHAGVARKLAFGRMPGGKRR